MLLPRHHFRLAAAVSALVAASVAAGAAEDVAPEIDPKLARYAEAVAKVEANTRSWTYNGRTYRLPIRGEGESTLAPTRRVYVMPEGGRRVERAGSGSAAEPGRGVAGGTGGGLGVFGIAVILGGVAGAVFVAVSFATRRKEVEAEGPTLMTATGLVVKFDDVGKQGTGLITLNKRDRGHTANVKIKTDPHRRPGTERHVSDPLLAAVAEAEAAVGGPDPTPASGIAEVDDPFEEVAPAATETVSERIRQKHQSSATRRHSRPAG